MISWKYGQSLEVEYKFINFKKKVVIVVWRIEVWKALLTASPTWSWMRWLIDWGQFKSRLADIE